MRSIANLPAIFDRKIAAVIREVEQAEKKTVEQARSMFVKRSSGTMTANQWRLLGYPYSARRPNAGVDPTYINVGISGDLRRSWVIAYPKIVNGMMRASVVNTSREAKFMFGTRLMTARRVDKAVAGAIRRIRLVNVRDAIKRGLRA